MSMNDDTSTNPNHDDVTQGENPGAQGDFGAGQGDPGTSDPVVGDDDVVEGDEQPRRDEEFGGDLNGDAQV